MKMKGILCKRFDTVILNGSDDVMVKNITEAIEIVTKERYGKSAIRTLGDTNVKVISTNTTARTYKKVRDMINNAYPNTCIFCARI